VSKVTRLNWVVLAFAVLCSASVNAHADDCDAAAGELAARIPGVKIGRRTSVVMFFEHHTIRVGSVGCPMGKGKPNLVFSAEGKFPGSDFFDFVAEASHIVAGVPNDKVREGAVRCHRAALMAADDNVEINFANLLFVCSADKPTTSIDVEVPSR
jgi:hypothetical protein